MNCYIIFKKKIFSQSDGCIFNKSYNFIFRLIIEQLWLSISNFTQNNVI